MTKRANLIVWPVLFTVRRNKNYNTSPNKNILSHWWHMKVSVGLKRHINNRSFKLKCLSHRYLSLCEQGLCSSEIITVLSYQFSIFPIKSWQIWCKWGQMGKKQFLHSSCISYLLHCPYCHCRRSPWQHCSLALSSQCDTHSASCSDPWCIAHSHCTALDNHLKEERERDIDQ